MTTLHRKPRGASALGGGELPSSYTTIDILPSVAPSPSSINSYRASGVSALFADKKQLDRTDGSTSSKARRLQHGSKYARRNSLFGGFSKKIGNTSPSSPSSKKMSTTQLRAFFAACVLVYLGALCFADDIVRLGKAVNSDVTRQRIFSTWRPMHSAASQYLRAIVDPLSPRPVDDSDADDDTNTAAPSPAEASLLSSLDVSERPKAESEPLTLATQAPAFAVTEGTTQSSEQVRVVDAVATAVSESLEPAQTSATTTDDTATSVHGNGDDAQNDAAMQDETRPLVAANAVVSDVELLDDAHTLPGVDALAIDLVEGVETDSSGAAEQEPLLVDEAGTRVASLAPMTAMPATETFLATDTTVTETTASTPHMATTAAAAADAPTEAAAAATESVTPSPSDEPVV